MPNVSTFKEMKLFKRKSYIAQCHYYKGRKTPEALMGDLFTGYEESWVNFHFDDEGRNYLNNITDYYLNHTSLAHFNTDDGVPVSLKAVLLNRWEHWQSGCYETAEACENDFKDWYLHEYLGV